MCAPLWSATIYGGGGQITTSPAVANGVAYAGSGLTLRAFDAAGSLGCAGVPKVCAPLWTATDPAPIFSGPTVADGGVFVGRIDGLHAYRLAR